ncbi:metal-dependent transcriptional regulator [Opitutales bacterium ASA1]|uniref:metal-dependent transcriptional regulator n=1 Tax=Congregicoccus parvus TaxID=3081749 RepID=UPI002B2CCA4B|nr:metal-dependent transcriptional regulator [Opitutales bacterium ASA1]
MATSTVENYVKHIFHLDQQRQAQSLASGVADTGLVAMGELAAALRVVPGTATSMIKTLADAGLVDYEPRNGVRLTEPGRRLALHVLRRHRLVELFLVQTLGMDWAEIHEEAEQLEHVISERVLERIDALLGHPTVDPHGDLIPDAAGRLADRPLISLSELPLDTERTVARIADQADAFLQFIDGQELRPGRGVRVIGRDTQAGVLRARLDNGREVSLGFAAAAKIEVEA